MLDVGSMAGWGITMNRRVTPRDPRTAANGSAPSVSEISVIADIARIDQPDENLSHTPRQAPVTATL